MDNTGIIQLVTATIFYSTLIAPNIKKMNDIKADISDMKFPLKSADNYASISDELTTSINKKMKQYGAAYSETQKLLWLLYFAMSIGLGSQIFGLWQAWSHHRPVSPTTSMSAAVTFAIFLLLIIAMRIFIIKPERIRTFDWLSSVGVAATYAQDIFNPSLELNSVSKNLRESNNHAHIKLASSIGLYGYNIILTIENISGKQIYHTVAGRIQKSRYIKGGHSYYRDGRSRAIIDLVHSLSLKPGKYKTRLLVFETVFPGAARPVEILAGFEITATNAESSIIDIDLSNETQEYSYKVSNGKPCNVEFSEALTRADGVKMLLASHRFQKMFSNSTILFTLGDQNGAITYDRIEHMLHPMHVLRARIILFFQARSLRKVPQKSIHLSIK